MPKDDVIGEIVVQDSPIRVRRFGNVDYISLTDLASRFNAGDPSGIIRNWMSNKNSFDYYGLWEMINNPNFNSVEFHRIKIEEAPLHRFTMTPKIWKQNFNAIGIVPSAGKYSIGTFAHPDIAFEFASWISPEFKLYLIREFERLKKDEQYQYKIEWKANRLLAKANYTIHTDAIKNNIIPDLTEKQKSFAYANEADVLNMALFGVTAKEWREANPELAKNSNIRDNTDLLHLIILNNLENINAQLIKDHVPQSERLMKLNNTAREQLELLKNNQSMIALDRMQQNMNLEAEAMKAHERLLGDKK